ncbi:hypothetical protein ABZT17_07535 [Streptomyces sp. NPDC005648]|uniref:hypothetical protein n=1 Tax=Streptomyces sp. NPDC005648 TaxID=3157044 RepID=UPI0033BA99B2
MTAGHEAHESHGSHEIPGYDGADALMAAITGAEPSAEALADAAFAAEHREAVADVALLRERLGLIGDALAEAPRPERRPVPVRVSRPARPRMRRFATAGLAVAAVAGVLSGMGWLLAQAGGGAADSASSAQGAKSADSAARSPFFSANFLACSALVAEGDVTRVERVAGNPGRERVTLHITRSYKPEKGKKDITFLLDPDTVSKALHKGDRLLVAIPPHSATPDQVVVGETSIATERAGITEALPQATALPCG